MIAMTAQLKAVTTCVNPVFIIGSPRSGTSALAWALAQCGELWTSRESDILWNLFGSGHIEAAWKKANDRLEGDWLRELRVDRYEFLEHAGAGINALLTNRSGGRRWIDQTPVHTFMLDLLAEMFPGAKFLHMLRDGRRVVHSMIHFGHAANDSIRLEMAQTGQLPLWAKDFPSACDAWQMFTRVAFEFASRRPDRVLTVWNERLSTNPEEGFEKILRFLEVEPNTQCAEFFSSHRINSSFGADGFKAQPTEPPPNPWTQWSPALRSLFDRTTREVVELYELAWDEEGSMRPANWTENYQRYVRRTVGTDALIAVISRGDDSMGKIPELRSMHFPSDEQGRYLGYHPHDSDAATDLLKQATTRGVTHLVIPAPSLWWLDYYPGLRYQLESQNHLVGGQAKLALIYDLRAVLANANDMIPELVVLN